MMRIFIRDLRLNMLVGVYEHEHTTPQEVIVNFEATVTEPVDWTQDNLDDWVSYEEVVNQIKTIAARRHLCLLETFANIIAEEVMKESRINSVRISLEKTSAISSTRSVGVEIKKSRNLLGCDKVAR